MKEKKIISYLFFLTFLIISLSFIKPVAAASDTYHIKVNRYTNTVTVYQKQKDGSYSPIKAMLCSTGGKNTPLGTFRTNTKYMDLYCFIPSHIYAKMLLPYSVENMKSLELQLLMAVSDSLLKMSNGSMTTALMVLKSLFTLQTIPVL